MSTFKKKMRLLALICMVIVASMIPIPMKFHTKDKLPSHVIEQIDPKDEEDEDKEAKEIF